VSNLTEQQKKELTRIIHNTLLFNGRPWLATLEYLAENNLRQSVQIEEVYCNALDTFSKEALS
jgi:hypothetical protein